MSNATAIDVIYSESLKSVCLPLLPVEEQKKILEVIHQEVDKHDRLSASISMIKLVDDFRVSLASETLFSTPNKAILRSCLDNSHAI